MAKMDSAPEEGTQAQANAESSQNQVGQPSSEQEYVTIDQLNALQKSIDALSRGLQSNKDRAVKNVNQRIDSLEGDIKQVLRGAVERGQSVSEVLGQIERKEQDDMNEALRQMVTAWQSSAQQNQSGGSGGGSGVNISQVLTDFEFDPNDTMVKEFASRSFQSEAEAYQAGLKLQRTMQQIQPTDADKPSEVEGRQQAATKQQALMAEYEEGAKNLRGNQLLNYKLEMRKKGLEIS